MRRLLGCMCLLLLAMGAGAQSHYYWNLGWNCIYGHRLPAVGHYAYDYFVKGEQQGEDGCARVVMAGLTLLDPTPARNRSEVIRLIGKWYTKDEKVALMAASFYLPKNTFDPGEIILSWHSGTAERYPYVPGQYPNLKQSLFYAKYAYEKLNSGDGDSERFYKNLLAWCYNNGAAGYAKDPRKAAKLAAEVENFTYLESLIASSNSLKELTALIKETLPEVTDFDTDGSAGGVEACYAARRNLLRDRYFDKSAEEKTAEWNTMPKEMKDYLNSEAVRYCSEETDLSGLMAFLKTWPDPSVSETVHANLLTDYSKKAGRIISSTKNLASGVPALRKYADDLRASGLVSSEKVDDVEKDIRKSFASDISSRAKRAFVSSSYDRQRTIELLDYTKALSDAGYIQSSQWSLVASPMEAFLDQAVTRMHSSRYSSESSATELLATTRDINQKSSVLAKNVSLIKAETAAREVLDLASARKANTSTAFGSFLSSYPDGYAPYHEEAQSKYATLLTQEQDQAAFERAYSLTQKPSASEKKSILSMPMSSSMRSTVSSMLTAKYVRQHNNSTYSDESFRNATMSHSSLIDWNTSGPLAIHFGGIVGSISGSGWKYGANGFYAGLSYNFNIAKSVGIETGAFYFFEKGKYEDSEFDFKTKDGLLRQAAGIPLHLTVGASGGRISSGSISCVFFTGPSFRYYFLGKGYYAGEYHERLAQETDWFRPFDVRYDLGVSFSISHFMLSLSGDLGLRHTNLREGNRLFDYRLYLGAAVIF